MKKINTALFLLFLAIFTACGPQEASLDISQKQPQPPGRIPIEEILDEVSSQISNNKIDLEASVVEPSVPVEQKEEPVVNTQPVQIEPAPAPAQNCHPSYSGCLNPNASDYDCAGGSGNGPYYTAKVRVIGSDVFGLDRDHDGWGCE